MPSIGYDWLISPGDDRRPYVSVGDAHPAGIGTVGAIQIKASMDKSVADNSADVSTVFAAEHPIPYETTNRSPRWRKDVVALTGQRTPILRPEVRHRHSRKLIRQLYLTTYAYYSTANSSGRESSSPSPPPPRGCGSVMGRTVRVRHPPGWPPRRAGTRWAGEVSVAGEVEPRAVRTHEAPWPGRPVCPARPQPRSGLYGGQGLIPVSFTLKRPGHGVGRGRRRRVRLQAELHCR
jgi:hypothetical protein